GPCTSFSCVSRSTTTSGSLPESPAHSPLERPSVPVTDRPGSHDLEPGPYLQTVSGRRLDPFTPDLEQIDVADIATALANQCRFGGHTRVFYSVAQHSCLVTDVLRERGGSATELRWALLHDASEAYLVDLPHPIKHRSELGRLYAEAEAGLQQAICE